MCLQCPGALDQEYGDDIVDLSDLDEGVLPQFQYINRQCDCDILWLLFALWMHALRSPALFSITSVGQAVVCSSGIWKGFPNLCDTASQSLQKHLRNVGSETHWSKESGFAKGLFDQDVHTSYACQTWDAAYPKYPRHTIDPIEVFRTSGCLHAICEIRCVMMSLQINRSIYIDSRSTLTDWSSLTRNC